MIKKNPPKISTTIDSYYKVKNSDTASFSKDYADLTCIIKDADQDVVYYKPTDWELSKLERWNSELAIIKQEMKKPSDAKKALKFGIEVDAL